MLLTTFYVIIDRKADLNFKELGGKVISTKSNLLIFK